MKILKNIFLITILSFFACSEADKNDIDACTNECVLINNDIYKETKTDNYAINSVIINGDLLTIQISASGCSGSTWTANLIDSGAIAESFPIQRFLKIALINKELCTAVVGKEFTFNIKELKKNQPEIILNLEGWNTQIKY